MLVVDSMSDVESVDPSSETVGALEVVQDLGDLRGYDDGDGIRAVESVPRFLEGRVPAPISCIGGRTSSARRLVEVGILPKSSSWSVSMQGKGGGMPDSSL